MRRGLLKNAGRMAALWLLTGLSGNRTATAQSPETTRSGAPAGEERLPLWEIGVFGGITRIPHYRGSDEYHVYAIPLPYFIYRGEIFQADRDGVRGIFFSSPHFESNLAFSGNPPVGNENEARRGMPELDPILEIGPGFNWYLQDKEAPQRWYVRTAVRAAASAGSGGLEYRGLHGGVNLAYDDRSHWARSRIRYGLSLGLDLAGWQYNEYLYGVPAEYATPERPAYRAQAGYGGGICPCTESARLRNPSQPGCSPGGTR
jgi:MipA family protein